jgi:hydrogenase large subunit
VPRIVVGPFNRVEGDLEVTLEVADGVVREARVTAPLYRGFEQLLVGKPPLDALVLVPRVCGICSATQSAAAAAALADAAGVEVPANGRRATNLVLACEILADHLTHFYLFFMPDFARPAYEGRRWWPAVAERFRALSGSAAREAIAARAAFLGVMGLLAGKWPHTLSLQPGGSSRPVQPAERIQLHLVLRAFRAFVEETFLGDRLEAFAALGAAAELRAWARGAAGPRRGDLPAFLELAEDLGLDRVGAAADRFMSYGAYPLPGAGAGWLFPRGVFDVRAPGGADAVRPLDPSAIREDPAHAWLAGEALHPSRGETVPVAEKAGAYTWCKAPRLDGEVVEVGALARQLVAGHPLARDLARAGANVTARVVARALELAIVLPEMERWVRALEPGAPFCAPASIPQHGAGAGLVEAARGALGHWITLQGGRIARWQIVAPTTWNFSPRDAAGRPGPLERALVGVAAEDARSPAVQHVVRSFDPCLVCTVH